LTSLLIFSAIGALPAGRQGSAFGGELTSNVIVLGLTKEWITKNGLSKLEGEFWRLKPGCLLVKLTVP